MDVELAERFGESPFIHFDISGVIWIVLVNNFLIILIKDFGLLSNADSFATQAHLRIDEDLL